ncbi:MAG: nitrile hydratase accessory protein [Bauldia sp.]
MSGPESSFAPRRQGAGGPVFTEAWHAEALGVANVLTANGLFSAAEWAGALGAALERAAASGRPDIDATYYDAVLEALEGLIVAKSPATGAGMAERVDAWRRAYLNTPHGKPVALSAADLHDHGDDEHHHHHHHDHRA